MDQTLLSSLDGEQAFILAEGQPLGGGGLRRPPENFDIFCLKVGLILPCCYNYYWLININCPINYNWAWAGQNNNQGEGMRRQAGTQKCLARASPQVVKKKPDREIRCLCFFANKAANVHFSNYDVFLWLVGCFFLFHMPYGLDN